MAHVAIAILLLSAIAWCAVLVGRTLSAVWHARQEVRHEQAADVFDRVWAQLVVAQTMIVANRDLAIERGRDRLWKARAN